MDHSESIFRKKDLRERGQRVAALRQRFERASQNGRHQGLGRLGLWAMAAFWCLCLTVIGVGLDRLHPQVRQRFAYALRNPAEDLARPFATCGAAHAAGYYDIPEGSAAYVPGQDDDRNGRACEPLPGLGPTMSDRAATAWTRWEHYQGG